MKNKECNDMIAQNSSQHLYSRTIRRHQPCTHLMPRHLLLFKNGPLLTLFHLLCLLLTIGRTLAVSAESASTIEGMNPILRYRLRTQLQERLKLLDQNLNRKQPKDFSARVKPLLWQGNKMQKPLAGRNCFFSPIQCQLPVLQISQKMDNNAPMYTSANQATKTKNTEEKNEEESAMQDFRRRRRRRSLPLWVLPKMLQIVSPGRPTTSNQMADSSTLSPHYPYPFLSKIRPPVIVLALFSSSVNGADYKSSPQIEADHALTMENLKSSGLIESLLH
ncbi:hypothetical protein DdX_03860 [Ditylenchus destructor]|uniref:Uncharacterized protein n=1 Tax=Ditylenchus destructor TaxID=166010 RepID=A0AAD4NG11_9BILA|nr:hypothetical protein DdX_03860 [Ditylenchus destructor]